MISSLNLKFGTANVSGCKTAFSKTRCNIFSWSRGYLEPASHAAWNFCNDVCIAPVDTVTTIRSAQEFGQQGHGRQVQVDELKADLVLAIAENAVRRLGARLDAAGLALHEQIEAQFARPARRDRLGITDADAVAADVDGAGDQRRGAVEGDDGAGLQYLARRCSLFIKHGGSNKLRRSIHVL